MSRLNAMRKIIYSIIFLTVLSIGAVRTSAATGDLFPYPVPPDTMQLFQSRCDYIVNRFWDRCNFDRAMNEPEKFNAVFGDWVSIIPHASADTAHVAINKLLKRFEKKGDITLQLANMAENWLFSDTAQFISPEVYLPFAKAAATNKKISKADRARYEGQVRILESSSVGCTVPPIAIIKSDGSAGKLNEISGNSIFLFFNDPDCMECSMARVRLNTDPSTQELIKNGELTIVSIYPGDAEDDSWEKARNNTPEDWICIAMPEAYDYFDIRTLPTFYFLNKEHKVLLSGVNENYFLNSFRGAVQLKKNQAEIKKQLREAAIEAAKQQAQEKTTEPTQE